MLRRCPECEGWGHVYEDESYDPETGDEGVCMTECPACRGTGEIEVEGT